MCYCADGPGTHPAQSKATHRSSHGAWFYLCKTCRTRMSLRQEVGTWSPGAEGGAGGWVSSWGHENVLEPERQRQRLHNTANVLNATEPSTGTWLVFG